MTLLPNNRGGVTNTNSRSQFIDSLDHRCCSERNIVARILIASRACLIFHSGGMSACLVRRLSSVLTHVHPVELWKHLLRDP